MDSRNLIRPIGIPELEIKLEGDWQQAVDLVGSLPQAIYGGYEKGSTSFMRKLEKVIKRSIITSTPPEGSGIRWAPLSPKTIKRYGSHGIYNMTGAYLRAIGISKTRKGRIYLGVERGKRHPTHNKLTIVNIANILEKGSNDGRIPARPLWRPAYSGLGGNKRLKNTILKSIRSTLIQYGVRPNQVRVKSW